MGYLLLFLEGIITFISPCFLPLLPVYISYFSGAKANQSDEVTTRHPLGNAIGFVLGFTIVFMALGAFAGIIGQFLRDYKVALNVVTGLVVVIFGLNYLGAIPFIGTFPLSFTLAKIRSKLLKTNTRLSTSMSSSTNVRTRIRIGTSIKPLTFASSLLFGIVFSIGWTPCVGPFLGSALLRASQQGSMLEGTFMLFIFSMGLGLPLIICALLIDRLKNTFAFIKRHYQVINILSGSLLVLVGILMISGIFGRFAALFVV